MWLQQFGSRSFSLASYCNANVGIRQAKERWGNVVLGHPLAAVFTPKALNSNSPGWRSAPWDRKIRGMAYAEGFHKKPRGFCTMCNSFGKGSWHLYFPRRRVDMV